MAPPVASGQPTGRPYGSPADLDGNSGRQGEFLTGYAGSGDIAGNSSIITNSARWNAATPRQFSQHSVLQTAMPSANGLSDRDAQRMLPGLSGLLPTQNGSSSSSYAQGIYMHLAGQAEI
jgi:hypothetical protein